mgnify:FL=1
MTEHTWTEGKGLKNGLPDIDWATRKFITVYPAEIGWEDETDDEGNFNPIMGWTINICWGNTWGQIAFAKDEDFVTAMKLACRRAIKDGCPTEWLPYTGDEEE